MQQAGAQVLVIDDVEAIVDELVTLLGLQDIPAIGACTLDQAVAALEQAPQVRVIACDVRLDGESGLDIVSRVQAHPTLARRAFHHVFITGDPLCPSRLPLATRHSVLAKPVQPRTLIDLFQELLATADVE